MAELRTIVALAAAVATGVGCGGGKAPQLAALEDQEVAVGTELVIQLVGTDEDGDNLDYEFSADVPDIYQRASITRRPDGSGLFRWTPLAADVGAWFFDFSVKDGDGSDTQTIQIDVKSAIGDNSAPVFRQPLGTGTTLDLAQKRCLDLDIVVEDQDSASVVIGQEEPIVEGATITSTGGLTATWQWCPSEAQIEDDDRYTLVLSADDLTNRKTVKHYLIVLRKQPKDNCPGDPPVVAHTPADESTLVNLTIAADISDDQGLKEAPLFYYSDSAPANPPDLGAMTQLTMELISGDMMDGVWAADVPNPVAGGSAGSMADVHYVIVAEDNDDAAGDCDHLTQSPGTGAYSMTVTNPGGSGGAAICEPCSTDIQCGGAGDLCVRSGPANDPFCLKACSGPSDCPTDYSCSVDPVDSVDGTSARQCVPNSNDCSNPGGITCTDDGYEENDSRAQAEAEAVLMPGDYDLVSCPAVSGDDEDWFKIDVSSDASVSVEILGDDFSDLDLALYDASGNRLLSSLSTTSSEMVSDCLTPGIYYIRVYVIPTPAENPYILSYSQTPMSCAPACVDDDAEDDDDPASARPLTFTQVSVGADGPYVSQTNAICTGDPDYFRVFMIDGEMITVDLTFTDADGDLDLYVYNEAGSQVASGLTTTDNEHVEFTLTDATCTLSNFCPHFIAVKGYGGAENLYDISIALDDAP